MTTLGFTWQVLFFTDDIAAFKVSQILISVVEMNEGLFKCDQLDLELRRKCMCKFMSLSNLIWPHKFDVNVYMKDFQIFINNTVQYLESNYISKCTHWRHSDHKLIIFPSNNIFTWHVYFCHISLWHLKLKTHGQYKSTFHFLSYLA